MSAARKLFSPAYWRGDSAVAAWLRGAGWLFSSSLVERAAALVQTVLIARALHLENYGRYGLLFSTISTLSPIVSLQLPYSVIYFVSRFQASDPAKAGAIVLLGRRLTLATTLAALIASALFARPLSVWLFDDDGYAWPVVLGGVILLATVQAGLSDTLLQASERFRTLAIARVSTALVGLAALVPVMIYAPTLTAVLAVIAGGSVIRLIAVAVPARRLSAPLVAQTNLRQALGSARAIVDFSLPSGLLSVVTGLSVWTGNYVLTRRPSGYHDLGIINTGLQWRTPILVVMASLASAILPMLGRYLGASEHEQTRRLQRYHVWLNLTVALGFSVIAVLGSSLILALYGPSFRGQNFLFALFLIPLVPTAYVTARQQELVADGRMWQQLALFIPFAAITVGGTLWFADVLTGAILGYIQLGAWVVTAALIALLVPPPGGDPAPPVEEA